jgi:hypothetical protein
MVMNIMIKIMKNFRYQLKARPFIKAHKKGLKLALKALKMKMEGVHPPAKMMKKIIESSAWNEIKVIGYKQGDDDHFWEGSRFGHYQYLEIEFESPISDSNFTLTTLPFKEVEEALEWVIMV